MENQLIHHYTSIGALAAILRHKTIRFGRLDTLDDTQEAQSIGGFDFGKMLFASCWVEKPEEDIAQWAMYGDAMKGVRISLPRQPFALVPRLASLHSMQDIRGQGYILLPDLIDNENDFLSRVNYVDDVAAEYASRVEILGNGFRINGRATAIATFKNKYWSFQQEVRFILQASPGPVGWIDDSQWATKFVELAESGGWGAFGPETTFIDRKLATDALDRGEVVLGPLATESDRLIVESLIATLAPGLQLRQSKLTGLIRHR
ncbi:DUF2971 domain-containing protein [Pseudoxanthomonas suwonensis]|uniref:DUF2971 domain-containing protein n=1 Tax=Pseudoxanthomonas suwonensis TaxID=314722 RepID=UPI0012DE4CA1|nr:DUF2971 domain-containing protein [Pseudoxanthomonas suwonensis]